MVEVHFGGETFQIERIIAQVKSNPDINRDKKSILVFIGGIHGNEPTGVIALKKVFDSLSQSNLDWKGDVYAFTGNLQALAAEKRFIHKDLNRVWTPNEVERISTHVLEKTISETEEQYALYDLIWPLLEEKVPIYFIDLHTTSATSAPFITINDIIVNRDYSAKFPVPIVIGIEEYISGPLLSYMNNLETVSLAFEGGQHQDLEAMENHISFIHMAMVLAGSIDANQLPNYNFHCNRLTERAKDTRGIYEIRFKKHIEHNDGFKMVEGFNNFDLIEKDELIATDQNGEIKSLENGRIFMPLYQVQGNDGFFIIKDVPKWAMIASRFMRRLKLDRLLTVFPGINRDPKDENTLLVNTKVAKFFANEIFHLLGYRRKKNVDKTMYFSRREID